MKLILMFGLLAMILLVSGCVQEVVTEEEYCGDMSLAEAKEIAADSECAEGALEEEHMCNSDTGTWWIDLDIEKEGCAPACVVNVVTKEAEINWRCTGVITE